jgi:hypothetical protein
MIKHSKFLNWAFQYLASNKKSEIFNYQKVVDTSYSAVYKIDTEEDIFYLKQVPKTLFSEPKILNFLNNQGCKNLPAVLAINNDLCCFLMISCGDTSLRQLFDGVIDLTKLSQGISSYTAIQRLVENKVDQLLSFGIPDWRLDKFASLYYQLIQQHELLLADGLTKKEIERLNQLYPTCVELCEDLSKYKIPETINHCDFHENNMLFDKKTLAINIIDWGETVITHPFFSLQGCLWNITYFYKIKQNDMMYNKLQYQCIASWRDLCDDDKLLQILGIANRLNGIYAALGYERMYLATEDQSKKVRLDHHGSIAGCLRSFLDLNNK